MKSEVRTHGQFCAGRVQERCRANGQHNKDQTRWARLTDDSSSDLRLLFPKPTEAATGCAGSDA